MKWMIALGFMLVLGSCKRTTTARASDAAAADVAASDAAAPDAAPADAAGPDASYDRSGDIADGLDRKVTALAPVRSGLILKGMIWSPNHGDTAFTVPLFDEFMKRIMPGDSWHG